jgi:carbon-monoxide dehydrogenase small subunit
MLAEGFLAQEPEADRDAVRDALSANLCRCTGYQTIVDAVTDVAARRREPTATATPPSTPKGTAP